VDENIRGLYMGTEVHLIVTGDINSPIKNCCATLEILVMLKKVTVHKDSIIIFFTAAVVLRTDHTLASYLYHISPLLLG